MPQQSANAETLSVYRAVNPARGPNARAYSLSHPTPKYDGQVKNLPMERVVNSFSFLRKAAVAAFCSLSFGSASSVALAQQPLKISVLDVEGGQATLILTPAGQSLLVDTGYPGNGDRDLNRVLAALKKSGIKKLDYLVVTHYHTDHLGNVPGIVKVFPVGTFVDHGENEELTDMVKKDFAEYKTAVGTTHRLVVKPGDTLPLKGLQVTIVSAAGKVLKQPIPGVNPSTTPLCRKPAEYPVDDTENARSVGMLFRFGKFTFADLGDLTKAKEVALVCPSNPLGHVSLFLTSHHGLDWSNSPELLDALQPRVAIMNNGPKKGGSPVAWQIIHDSKGLEEFWQSHTAEVPNAKNLDEAHIANLAGHDGGNAFEVTAQTDGSFTVTNTRNGLSKSYKAR